MLLNILLTLLIIVGVALTGLVLLQRSEGGALGMGGGGQLVSARGAANFLTRTTWILGVIFFAIALLITILLGRQSGAGSITDRMQIEARDPSQMAAEQKARIEQERAKAAGQIPGLPLPGATPAPAPATPGLAPLAPSAAPKAPAATTPPAAEPFSLPTIPSPSSGQ